MALALFGAANLDGAAPVYPTFSKADLTADLDQFERWITSIHPLIYADEADLAGAFEATYERLQDDMSELEFLRLLAPLLRRVNCGHSELQLSPQTALAVAPQRRLLPLQVACVGDRLFVTHAPLDSAVPRGAEIHAINGRSSGELIADLYDHVTADGLNVTRKTRRLSRHFGEWLDLYLESNDTFSVTFTDPVTGSTDTADLAGVEHTTWQALRPSTPVPNFGIGHAEWHDDHARLILRSFNFYDPVGMQRVRDFIDTFFRDLAANPRPRLILDLRGNGGGEPRLAGHLFSYLIDSPQVYFSADAGYYPTLLTPTMPAPERFTGALFVLVDGDCFSTTGHLCSLLRYHGIGRFVGEETGGSFSTTANTTDLLLPRTRLRLRLARNTFTTAVSGLEPARGVFPHDVILPDAHDIITGTDPVMAHALALFRDPPVVSRPPQSLNVRTGRDALFTAAVDGDALSYQWRHDGIDLPGATGSTLLLPAVSADDAGNYTVRVSNPAGFVESDPATLKISADGAARLVNLSARAHAGTGEATLIPGFALAGAGEHELLVRAVGPHLATLGVAEPLPDPHFSIIPHGASGAIAANDNWGDAPEAESMEQARAAVGAFPLPASDAEASLLVSLSAGAYTAPTADTADRAGVALVELYDTTTFTDLGTLANLSARAWVGPGDAAFIAGFAVQGNTPLTLLIRAVGPGLATHGVAGFLPNPVLTLTRSLPAGGSEIVVTNDDWSFAPEAARIAATSAAIGAFSLPTGGTDAVLLVALPPGAYTALVQSADESTGIALAEVYVVPPGTIAAAP